jgi:hypothetical protein
LRKKVENIMHHQNTDNNNISILYKFIKEYDKLWINKF